MSFGTLLIRTAGLLGRANPRTNPRPSDNASPPEDRVPGVTHSPSTKDQQSITESDHTPAGETRLPLTMDPPSNPESKKGEGDEYVAREAALHDTDDEDDDVSMRSWNEDGGGPVFRGATTGAAKELQDIVKEKTKRMLEEAGNMSEREKLCQCFREISRKVENGDQFESKEEYHTFKRLENLLSIDILKDDVAVVSTTLVNSGHSIIKDNFKGDHTIVQEASKANNGEIFIALAQCDATMHMSGDPAQLPPQLQDVTRV